MPSKKQTTNAALERKANVDTLRSELQQLRERHEGEIARRDGQAQRRGAEIVAHVAKRVAVNAPPSRADLAQARDGGMLVERRGFRGATWRGPTHGQFFAEAGALRDATLRECAAGYAETWGKNWSEQDGARLLAMVRGTPDAVRTAETKAVEVYGELRAAIERARTFARANYNQAHGAATIALDALWEHLPALPLASDLPGYVRTESEIGRFVAFWERASWTTLGRAMDRRELAELAILAGILTPTYAALLRDATRERKVGRGRYAKARSTSEVIEDAAKRLDRHRDPQRDAGG